MKVSAEKVCLTLRSKGIPHADVRLFKVLVSQFDDSMHLIVADHLRKIALTDQAEESIQFIKRLESMVVQAQSNDQLSRLLALELGRLNAPPTASQIVGVHEPHSLRTEAEKDVMRRKHYIYGNQSAFMFELDFLKFKSGQLRQMRTITVEAAWKEQSMRYDWSNRVSFQLTQLELPQFTAVMLGTLPDGGLWEARNHGRSNDKHLRCKEQDDSLFMKLEQAGTRWPIRVDQAHRYQVLSLCIEALKHNDPHLDIGAIQQLCIAAFPRRIEKFS